MNSKYLSKPVVIFFSLTVVFSISLYYFVSTALSDTVTLNNRQSVSIYDRDYLNITGAILHTEAGNIAIKFDDGFATKTIANFIRLSQNGFYDDTKFHRVIKDFMIQGGDPFTKFDDISKYGKGGPGYTFKDEISYLPMVRGVIAMANRGPNTNGSQFFILTTDRRDLTGKYTIFGYVVEGMENVDAIDGAPAYGDRPVDPIKVNLIEPTE